MEEEYKRKVEYRYAVAAFSILVTGDVERKSFPRGKREQGVLQEDVRGAKVLGIFQHDVVKDNERKGDEAYDQFLDVAWPKDSILHRQIDRHLILIGYDPNLLNQGYTKGDIDAAISDVRRRIAIYPVNEMPDPNEKDIDFITSTLIDAKTGLGKIVERLERNQDTNSREFGLASLDFEMHRLKHQSSIMEMVRNQRKYGLTKKEWAGVRTSVSDTEFVRIFS